MSSRRILLTVGTRPEAIKMAPVVLSMRSRPEEFDVVLVSTGQHREMLAQALAPFGIEPDIDLQLMTANQTLGELTGRVMGVMESTLAAVSPAMVLVQGDTTTVFASALAAFYQHIPVGHVEAGLRSFDLENPYPEEANRRLASVLTALHLAPTALARQRLIDESVSADRIVVTGNTVVDSVSEILNRTPRPNGRLAGVPAAGRRLLLVTSHRRESIGVELENICHAIVDLTCVIPDLEVVCPVHLNPAVRGTLERLLGGVDRIHLTAPLDYVQFIHLMARCDLVLTDSGGVQEEAPTLGKPLLVLRNVTERPEASQSGLSKVIGTDRQVIVDEVVTLLDSPQLYRKMTMVGNPYGDGHAARRVADAVSGWLDGCRPALPRMAEFAPSGRLEVSA